MSWASLVGAVTGATAIMYALAPIALGALRVSDADRPRTYQMPAANVLLPFAFVSANLIFYWGGWDTNWKVLAAILVGLVIFVAGAFAVGTVRTSWFLNAPPARRAGSGDGSSVRRSGRG